LQQKLGAKSIWVHRKIKIAGSIKYFNFFSRSFSKFKMRFYFVISSLRREIYKLKGAFNFVELLKDVILYFSLLRAVGEAILTHKQTDCFGLPKQAS